MNRYAIERALWDVVSNPASAAALRDAPDRFIAGFRLDEEGARLLGQMDVRAMLALGLNPMLVMRAFQMVHGRDQLPRYIEKLKDPS